MNIPNVTPKEVAQGKIHWIRMEHVEGDHSKFYEIAFGQGTLVANWGRITANGKGSFRLSAHAAYQDFLDLWKEKERKGYATVGWDFYEKWPLHIRWEYPHLNSDQINIMIMNLDWLIREERRHPMRLANAYAQAIKERERVQRELGHLEARIIAIRALMTGGEA